MGTETLQMTPSSNCCINIHSHEVKLMDQEAAVPTFKLICIEEHVIVSRNVKTVVGASPLLNNKIMFDREQTRGLDWI